MGKKGALIVVSGPSGVGKGSICKRLREINPNAVVSVSATTREPREGEENGVDYFFLSKEEFESRIEIDGFYEYSYHFGNYYGTPREEVEKSLNEGYDVILEIDVNGGAIVREKGEDAFFVFVLPPNLDELKRRIENRGSESKSDIMNRLKRAVKELDYMRIYDYSIINEDIDLAAKQLNQILEVASLKCFRFSSLIQNIREDLKNLEK